MEARIAQAHDVAALVDLMAEFYAESNYPLDRDAACSAFQSLLNDPSLGRVWLLTLGYEPAGYVVATFVFSMEFCGRVAFLDDLFVRPQHRRRGLGSTAVEAVMRECRDRQVKALHVECSTDDGPAVRLYRRAGFRDQKQGRQVLTVCP